MEGRGNTNGQGSSSYAKGYKVRIATHPNRLAAVTFNTLNIGRRLKKKQPADLTTDIT